MFGARSRSHLLKGGWLISVRSRCFANMILFQNSIFFMQDLGPHSSLAHPFLAKISCIFVDNLALLEVATESLLYETLVAFVPLRSKSISTTVTLLTLLYILPLYT